MHPEGMTDRSRGLSAATPPDSERPNDPHPEGVPEVALLTHEGQCYGIAQSDPKKCRLPAPIAVVWQCRTTASVRGWVARAPSAMADGRLRSIIQRIAIRWTAGRARVGGSVLFDPTLPCYGDEFTNGFWIHWGSAGPPGIVGWRVCMICWRICA